MKKEVINTNVRENFPSRKIAAATVAAALMLVCLGTVAASVSDSNFNAAGYSKVNSREPYSWEIRIDSIADLEKIGIDPNYPLNGKYIQMADLDFTSYAKDPIQSGWKIKIVVNITGTAPEDSVEFTITYSNGIPLMNADVQFSFGKKIEIAGNTENGTISVLNSESGFDGTKMMFLIGGVNPDISDDAAFAFFMDADASGGQKEAYHIGNFRPIGSTALPFTGAYDGNGYSIKGMETAGFFVQDPGDNGDAVGMISVNEGDLKNIEMIDGSAALVNMNAPTIPSGHVAAGMITGRQGENGTMINCYNSGSAVASSYAGGISGYNGGMIRDSENIGTVTAVSRYAGGITGSNAATVLHSVNSGTISVIVNHYAGGISGTTRIGGLTSGNVNSGNIFAGNYYAGGISGVISAGGTVTDSINHGSVTSNQYAGGIAGSTGYDPVLDVQGIIANCVNFGQVRSGERVGGITGSNFGSVSDSINYGIVNGSGSSVGGIAGANGFISSTNYNLGASIQNCINSETVRSSSLRTGGITGINVGSISLSVNTGDVIVYTDSATATIYAGGIAGVSYGLIEICYNAGNVGVKAENRNQYVGGIVGGLNASGDFIESAVLIKNVYNTGNVLAGVLETSSSGSVFAGGIAGVLQEGTWDISVTNAYSIGMVKTGKAGSELDGGGVIGRYNISSVAGTVSESYYNNENVTVSATSYGVGVSAADLLLRTTYNNGDWFGHVWMIDDSEAAVEERINNGLPYFGSFNDMTIVSQNTASENVFDGDVASELSVTTKGGLLKYEWKVSSDGVIWSTAPGVSNAPVYNIGTVNVSNGKMFYKCIVSSMMPNGSEPQESEVAVITAYFSLEMSADTEDQMEYSLNGGVDWQVYTGKTMLIHNNSHVSDLWMKISVTDGKEFVKWIAGFEESSDAIWEYGAPTSNINVRAESKENAVLPDEGDNEAGGGADGSETGGNDIGGGADESETGGDGGNMFPILMVMVIAVIVAAVTLALWRR